MLTLGIIIGLACTWTLYLAAIAGISIMKPVEVAKNTNAKEELNYFF